MTNKTEAPTEHRLRRARKEGDIAKSQHTTVAASSVFWWLFFAIASAQIYAVCVNLVRSVMWADQAGSFDERYLLLKTAIGAALPVIGATLGLAALAVIVPEAAQTRGVVSFKRVAPDFNRVNPVQGAKNLFGVKTAVETGVELAQLTILLAIFSYELVAALKRLLGSFELSLGAQLGLVGDSLLRLMGIMCVALIAPAAVDMRLQYFQWRRRLRMDKHEIKREYRDEEGDPLVKGRRRAVHRELTR
jgi:type III secretion protein U